eukprot:Clim_evm22s169 gene=Clim_evmTU22s169
MNENRPNPVHAQTAAFDSDDEDFVEAGTQGQEGATNGGSGGEGPSFSTAGAADFYQTLNLARDCTDEDIRQAYKNLCRVHHPDKVQSDGDREAARRVFNRIQAAYETLIDPQKRAVYDMYGQRGLRTTLELAPHVTTAQEIRAEVERLERRQEELRLEQRTNARSTVVMTFDASALVPSLGSRAAKAARAAPKGRKSGAMGSFDTDDEDEEYEFILDEDDKAEEGSKEDEIDEDEEEAAADDKGRDGAVLAQEALRKHPAEARRPSQSGHPDEKRSPASQLMDPLVKITGMSLQQAIEMPITRSHVLSFSGFLTTRGDLANGKVSGAAGTVTVGLQQNITAMTSGEVEIAVGSGAYIGGKVLHRLDQISFVNAGINVSGLNFPNDVQPFAMYARQIGDTTTGYLTWKPSMDDSSMSTSISHHGENYRVMATLQFGLPRTFINATYIREFGVYKAKIVGRFGTTGVGVDYGGDYQATPHSRVGCYVTVAYPQGVLVKVKLVRVGQNYVFPITLSDTIGAEPVFWATAVPALIFAGIKRLVLDPLERGRRLDRIKRMREQDMEHHLERKREAREAVRVMRASVARKLAKEERSNGLIIVRALYGVLDSEMAAHEAESAEAQEAKAKRRQERQQRKEVERELRRQRLREQRQAQGINEGVPDNLDINLDSAPEYGEDDDDDDDDEDATMIDVTIPLQAMVEKSQLRLQDTSKRHLLGFYNPCPGEDPVLIIRYSFRGKMHEVTLKDTEAVALPKKSHLMESGGGASSQ